MAATVRLSTVDVDAIADARHNVANGDAIIKIGVFGSRADLLAKGGDIDLVIEVIGDKVESKQLAMDLRREICEKIGVQKIDFLVWNQNRNLNSDSTNNFYDLISQKNVNIWSKA